MTVHYLSTTEPESDTVTSVDIVRDAGITYRQLDYWTRTGLLYAHQAGNGPGYPRGYTREHIAVARLLKQLIDGGVALRVAAELAHELLQTGRATIAGFPIHLPEEH